MCLPVGLAVICLPQAAGWDSPIFTLIGGLIVAGYPIGGISICLIDDLHKCDILDENDGHKK